MFKNLQKELKKIGIKVDESIISMFLGAVVVILIGLLAYGYFRSNRPSSNPVTPAENEETASFSGQLTNPMATVALPTSHTVVAGETLWSIAEKYYASGYNYMDIAQINQIVDASKLEVGTKLTIPQAQVRLPLTVHQTLEPTITQSRIDGEKYVVLKGDYLWEIAIRAYGDGYRWVEIAKANNITSPDFIYAGDALTIPR